jgi:hypothetical protein
MSNRASAMLGEDMEYMGPVRLKDVVESQLNIFSVIRHLGDTGEIIIPDSFQFPDGYQIPDYSQRYQKTMNNGALTQREIDQLLTPINSFKSIIELETFLTERNPPEKPYGIFYEVVTLCRFFETKDSEEILADFEQKNEMEGMGNIQIPHTKIKLINYSICPKCGHVFSFKDLADYYANPKPDPAFKDKARQFREDTRVLCPECDSYFLPALIISDGTPKNEVQFLCRVQTMNAIEQFYQHKGIKVLSTRKKNLLTKEDSRKKRITGIRNDVLLKEMEPKPTLISNLLQYTPANLVLNLINGENVKNGDVLFGTWQ